MRLHELFKPADLIVPFDPVDKWDSIGRLVEHLVEVGRIPADASQGISDAVLGRAWKPVLVYQLRRRVPQIVEHILIQMLQSRGHDQVPAAAQDA